MRCLLFAAVLLALSVTQVMAAWSGYWTWTGNSWVWTWVWTSPTAGPSASASPVVSLADTADCCGITVSEFGSLQPAKVTYTGLLATDFAVSQGTNSDLTLAYVGTDPIAPGTPLGIMALFDPTVTPGSPPITLGFREAFRDASGDMLTDTGTISSSVPEPATAALLGGALLCLATCRRPGRRSTS